MIDNIPPFGMLIQSSLQILNAHLENRRIVNAVIFGNMLFTIPPFIEPFPFFYAGFRNI